MSRMRHIPVHARTRGCSKGHIPRNYAPVFESSTNMMGLTDMANVCRQQLLFLNAIGIRPAMFPDRRRQK